MEAQKYLRNQADVDWTRTEEGRFLVPQSSSRLPAEAVTKERSDKCETH